MKITSKAKSLLKEGAFEVLSKASRLESNGKEVIHLEIGEPDFTTPPNIIEKAKWAMDNSYTHYTPASGLDEAREAIAKYVSSRHGVPTSLDEVVIVPGSKNIVFFTLVCLVDEGDEVIYPDPGYPIYRSLIDFVGGKAVPLKLSEDKGFLVDPEELESIITPKTRLVILNSPHNPTGTVLDRQVISSIAEIIQKYDLYVLSDEIYSRIIYDQEHFSIYSIKGMKERTVLMDGLSKAYAMCGWRLGYGVVPLELSDYFETLMMNTNSCAAAFTQIAAIEALHSETSQAYVENMVSEFRLRRDVLVEKLSAIQEISFVIPQGAFYIYPNVSRTGLTSEEFAKQLLDEYGIAVLPGTGFGSEGLRYIRISYANSIGNIRKAMDRLQHYVRQYIHQANS